MSDLPPDGRLGLPEADQSGMKTSTACRTTGSVIYSTKTIT
jgi:hypothetical protein